RPADPADADFDAAALCPAAGPPVAVRFVLLRLSAGSARTAAAAADLAWREQREQHDAIRLNRDCLDTRDRRCRDADVSGQSAAASRLWLLLVSGADRHASGAGLSILVRHCPWGAR